jgi:hypothetical protein
MRIFASMLAGAGLLALAGLPLSNRAAADGPPVERAAAKTLDGRAALVKGAVPSRGASGPVLTFYHFQLPRPQSAPGIAGNSKGGDKSVGTGPVGRKVAESTGTLLLQKTKA